MQRKGGNIVEIVEKSFSEIDRIDQKYLFAVFNKVLMYCDIFVPPKGSSYNYVTVLGEGGVKDFVTIFLEP